MKDPRINFGSRGLAAALGFLIPGTGHLYQGRRLKGGIFAVCILSTFFAGLVLGEGQPVYSQLIVQPGGGSASMQLHSGHPSTQRPLGYYAQVFVGAPALPALVQSWRFAGNDNDPGPLESPLDIAFEGNLLSSGQGNRQHNIRINGQLQLQPGQGQQVTGTLTGTSNNGEAVNIEVNGQALLGKPIFGSPRQEFRCDLTPDDSGRYQQLIGTINRPFLNWFQAPRDNEELARMHDRLSQKFDIALVFTWIAGLLNIMAVWDAFDGPAFGYGDEETDEADDKKKTEPKSQ